MTKQTHALDIFINDENEIIRMYIAKQGYGLDILINDKDYMVKANVIRYCKRNKHIPLCKKIYMKHHISNLSYWDKMDLISNNKCLDILIAFLVYLP